MDPIADVVDIVLAVCSVGGLIISILSYIGSRRARLRAALALEGAVKAQADLVVLRKELASKGPES